MEDFDVFKSTICHAVKLAGDMDFVKQTVEQKTIERYVARKEYAESLYLLAMVDYLCRVNGEEQPAQYDDLRKMRLKSVLYPKSLLLLAALSEDKEYVQGLLDQSIPEFRRFNIIEGDIRNVV